MKLLKYLYALVFQNWGTTVTGIVLGAIALYLPLTPELQKLLAVFLATVGAMLPHPSNTDKLPGGIVAVMVLMICFLITSCSLIKNIVTPGLCDTAAVTAADAVKQAVLLLCQKNNPDVLTAKLSRFYYGAYDTVLTVNGVRGTYRIEGNLVRFQLENGYAGSWGTQ